MTSKTPRTRSSVMDYVDNVGTEKDVQRTARRRSEVAMAEQGQSSPGRRPVGRPPKRRSIAEEGAEQEVTPRHLIQNLLTVQGTANPITRKKQRVSDVVMRPPSSSSVRKTARRRSSGAALDLSAVIRKTTPRTNVLGFLEQASEATPVSRFAGDTTDRHSTTAQNVSSFTLNEVGVSLLEGRGSSGGASERVPGGGGRIMAKTRTLNIQLPQVTLTRLSPSQTPRSRVVVTTTTQGQEEVEQDVEQIESSDVTPQTSIRGKRSEVSPSERTELTVPEVFKEAVPFQWEEADEKTTVNINKSVRKSMSTSIAFETREETRTLHLARMSRRESETQEVRTVEVGTVDFPLQEGGEGGNRSKSGRNSIADEGSAQPVSEENSSESTTHSARNIFSDVFGAGDGGEEEGEQDGAQSTSRASKSASMRQTPLRSGRFSEATLTPSASVSDSSKGGEGADQTSRRADATPPRDSSSRKRKSNQTSLDSLWTPGRHGDSAAGDRSEAAADGSSHVSRQSRQRSEHIADASPSATPSKRPRRSGTPVPQEATTTPSSNRRSSSQMLPNRSGGNSSAASRRADAGSSATVTPSERLSSGKKSNTSGRVPTPHSARASTSRSGLSQTPQDDDDMPDDDGELFRKTPVRDKSLRGTKDYPITSTPRPDSRLQRSTPFIAKPTPTLWSATHPQSGSTREEITPASSPRREARTPASGSRKEGSTPASGSRREERTPASGLRRGERTPASGSRREERTPASGSRREARTPASGSRREARTPASGSRREERTPASGSRREGKTPASYSRRGVTPASTLNGSGKRQSQHLSSRDRGEGSGVRSRSSAFGRVSSGLEKEGFTREEPPILEPQTLEEDSDEAGPSNTQMPNLTLGDSDNDDDSDEDPNYSPLKTPRLPARVATPSTSFVRKQKTPMAAVAKTQRKPTAGRTSSRRPAKSMPTSVVKAIFNHFSKLRVSKEAIAEVEKVSEQYWKNLAEDLEAYALHAHRQVINESDFELLMRRQGFITDTCSLNTLIATYLPLEQRQELIPIARSGNVVEPKP